MDVELLHKIANMLDVLPKLLDDRVLWDASYWYVKSSSFDRISADAIGFACLLIPDFPLRLVPSGYDYGRHPVCKYDIRPTNNNSYLAYGSCYAAIARALDIPGQTAAELFVDYAPNPNAPSDYASKIRKYINQSCLIDSLHQ